MALGAQQACEAGNTPIHHHRSCSRASSVTWPKAFQLLITWGAALLLGTLLVRGGERWPEPLAIQPQLVWALVLGPPALLALWLATRWRHFDGDLNGDKGQSSNGIHEQV